MHPTRLFVTGTILVVFGLGLCALSLYALFSVNPATATSFVLENNFIKSGLAGLVGIVCAVVGGISIALGFYSRGESHQQTSTSTRARRYSHTRIRKRY